MKYSIYPFFENGEVKGYSVCKDVSILCSVPIMTFIDDDINHALQRAEELLEKLNESD